LPRSFDGAGGQWDSNKDQRRGDFGLAATELRDFVANSMDIAA
jgi:hypothetical protein